jgi:hypothetical protein
VPIYITVFLAFTLPAKMGGVRKGYVISNATRRLGTRIISAIITGKKPVQQATIN